MKGKSKYSEHGKQTSEMPATLFKKEKVRGKLAGVLLAAGVSGMAWACCQMNGTTIGCDGTRNMLVVCQLYPPVVAVCTMSSPGTEYQHATGGNPTGTMEASPRIGACSATAYAVGECCGGAVTQQTVVGFYGYAECSGDECPRT